MTTDLCTEAMQEAIDRYGAPKILKLTGAARADSIGRRNTFNREGVYACNADGA
jgi:hypothetical protein